MDRDKDAKLTYDEFVEGSKQDPTIVQVGDGSFLQTIVNSVGVSFRLAHVHTQALSLYDGLV